MYNGQVTSIKQVLWKAMRHPLAVDLTYEDAAEFATEAIRLLGAPLSFVDKVTNPPLKVQAYKVALPPELLNIRGVRYIQNFGDDELRSSSIAMRYATDIYHKSLECTDSYDKESYEDVTREYTYTVQAGIMHTSFPEGFIEISYKALPIDEEGYPLIPNDQKTLMAMEYYILYRFLEPLYDIGKITDKAFQRIDQKKCFYMGAAQNALKVANIDHLESIMNTVNRLIINTRAHEDFYKKAGDQERLRRYN